MLEKQLRKIKEEYVPIDFQAYTIQDGASPILAKVHSETGLSKEEMAKPVAQDERLWRISSLTASVDDETKILIVPVPESKRSVKVADTKYEVKTYGDLALEI